MRDYSQEGRNSIRKSTLSLKAGLIFSFFCLSYTPILSQQRVIDSLLIAADKIWSTDFARSDSIYRVVSQQIIAQGVEENLTTWMRVLHQRAIACLFHTKLASAKNYLNQADSAIKHYTTAPGFASDSFRIQTRVLEANYFYMVSNYEKALESFNESERSLSKLERLPSRCETLYQILQYQASIYYLQGEFESCIDRYLASIQYYDCYRPKGKFANYILLNRNIGQAFLKKGDIKKAHFYLFAAKRNLDACPPESRDLAIRHHALFLYHSIAEFYRAEDKMDSAKYFFMLTQQFLDSNPTYASRVNDGLAKIALAENNFEIARMYFKKSLEQIVQTRGEKHYLTASTYRSISTLYRDQLDYKNSLIYIQKALNSLSSSTDVDLDDYTQNPSLNLLYMPKEMVMTLNQKATLLTSFYQQKKADDLLLAARNTNLLAIQLLDSTRNEFSLEKDKVVLGEDAVKVYQTGLHLASILYEKTKDPKYLSECFDLMDRSRSAVLMDHIKLVKSFSGIPAELQDRERELKVELSVAEQQLYNAEVKKQETSSHRQHFGEIKKAYTALLNDIKRAAPNYYKLRIENTTSGLAETQSMLAADEALIEYFVSDTTLYTMAVTSTGAALYTAHIDLVREQVEALRQMLTSPTRFGHENFQSKWNEQTAYLYQKLVRPWQKTLSASKRIIIVPHDVLNYLPFEMLTPDPSQPPLVNTIAISYASSANLLREQKMMNARGDFFAGFNADYSNHKELPQLAGAVNELHSLRDIFGFRSSIFSAATAEEFRKEAAHYKIIHLALHSLINDEKPMFSRLVFTPSSADGNADITANELYSMELNAEIAVLSACETGLGKLHRGEGMMSLSRAFMYAGVPSTVISLWKVPDQSASVLMKKFYQFLKDGHRKDEALRLAKLDFVKENPELSHPFFWAGFIVNGKTDPVTLSYFSKRELLGMVITLACLLIITGIAIKIRKRKATQLSV
jgi:CHAT domain-containing protein